MGEPRRPPPSATGDGIRRPSTPRSPPSPTSPDAARRRPLSSAGAAAPRRRPRRAGARAADGRHPGARPAPAGRGVDRAGRWPARRSSSISCSSCSSATSARCAAFPPAPTAVWPLLPGLTDDPGALGARLPRPRRRRGALRPGGWRSPSTPPTAAGSPSAGGARRGVRRPLPPRAARRARVRPRRPPARPRSLPRPSAAAPARAGRRQPPDRRRPRPGGGALAAPRPPGRDRPGALPRRPLGRPHPYDLEALAREGNLGVLPLDPLSRRDRGRIARQEDEIPARSSPACSPNTWRRRRPPARPNPGGHLDAQPYSVSLKACCSCSSLCFAALPAAASWEVNGNATAPTSAPSTGASAPTPTSTPATAPRPSASSASRPTPTPPTTASFDSQSFNDTAVKGSYTGGFLSIARVGVRKGLPGGVDLGVSYGKALGGDVNFVSAEAPVRDLQRRPAVARPLGAGHRHAHDQRQGLRPRPVRRRAAALEGVHRAHPLRRRRHRRQPRDARLAPRRHASRTPPPTPWSTPASPSTCWCPRSTSRSRSGEAVQAAVRVGIGF